METLWSSTAEANRNSDNIALVRAIITSGLYPNVARVLPQRGRPNPHKPRSIRTQYERRVSLHPKSVNEKEREYESPWLMYREKIKSSKVSLGVFWGKLFDKFIIIYCISMSLLVHVCVCMLILSREAFIWLKFHSR